MVFFDFFLCENFNQGLITEIFEKKRKEKTFRIQKKIHQNFPSTFFETFVGMKNNYARTVFILTLNFLSHPAQSYFDENNLMKIIIRT